MIWVDSTVFRHSKLLRIILAENVVIEIWIQAISAVFGIVSVILHFLMCQIFNARKFVK
jgi:hypothetical protein